MIYCWVLLCSVHAFDCWCIVCSADNSAEVTVSCVAVGCSCTYTCSDEWRLDGQHAKSLRATTTTTDSITPSHTTTSLMLTN